MSKIVYLSVNNNLVKCHVGDGDFWELLRLQHARKGDIRHDVIHNMYERSKEVMRLKLASDIVASGRYTVVLDE